MEMKELLKSVCMTNCELYKMGIVSAGWSGKTIHMTKEAFREMFTEWNVKHSDGEYDRWYVIEDGFEFFCLVPF